MIQKVWIKQVRNLNEIVIDLLDKKHCFIYGDNNQGKTSILEAISLAIEFKSPIQEDLDKVMQEEKEECFIGIDINEKEKERRYIRYKRNGQKEILKNAKSIKKNQLKTHFCDYISADALHIFQKDPGFRRKLLDKFCCLQSQEYEVLLKEYETVLKQKNKYLKQEQCDLVLIKTLNETLAKRGAILVKKREEALKDIENEINRAKQEIMILDDNVEVSYDIKRIIQTGQESYEEAFYKTLEADTEKEKILKYTLSGPQRDDFSLSINKKHIFDFFSRGINRCFAILFRLAQINRLKEKKTLVCLLLDDTFAEIDDDNKQKLLTYMKKNMQLFYATTRKESLFLSYDEQVVSIQNGEIAYG
ncbi:hypothetical protein CL658_05340 [bacterium]|nr:hypothetical protein [bacterium]|tara:strand:+ start:2535 stop:3617 length:1083 start_codon:yes stop_codon:yes gene_type:complete